MTDDELIAACRNIGFDLTCGACAGVFYTGTGMGEHTCKPKLTEEERLKYGAKRAADLALRMLRAVPEATPLETVQGLIAATMLLWGEAGCHEQMLKAIHTLIDGLASVERRLRNKVKV